tara:strand:+ start:200 stop:1075 length:876 start_codon:yes stop_codon:yes gene_type:complete
MKRAEFIHFDNVSKYFGNNAALEKVDFKIQKNSIVGLLGPNGSGKSTLMRILSGLIISWEGDIYLEGQSVRKSNTILKRSGFLIEDPSFYEYLTAQQNLIMFSRLTNTEPMKVNKVLKKVDLFEEKDKKVSDYSYGMKQRLGIAQAILHDPDILFFDEPNNGLDPIGISTMNKTIDNLNKEGKTIFISTHILEDVKELCSHVIVLRDGKLVLDESIEGLIENEDIYIIKLNNTKIALDKFRSHSDVKVVDSNDKKITVKSAINIYDLISIIPSESQLNSISKDPNISRLFR